MKTDLYTKIVLTVIAITLIGLLVKDINFVSKATANELDLSGLRIEEATDEDEVSYFIYENSKLRNPFSKRNGRVDSFYDAPIYIITTSKRNF